MRKFVLLVGLFVLLGSSSAQAIPSFTGLGDLAGGSFQSNAYGVSADGSAVAGWGSTASGAEAFRWTQSGGMVGLSYFPGPPGGLSSRGLGVSADGTVAVGYSNTNLGAEAFRWTSASGMVGLGDLPGGSFSSVAYAVSGDGATVGVMLNP